MSLLLLFNNGDFTPTSVSGNRLWHDGADTSSILTGATFTWLDKSGFGNHSVQSTGSLQPTTGVTTQNGKNVIDFDGTQYLNGASGLYGIPNGANTVFVVSKRVEENGTVDTTFSMNTAARADFFHIYSSVANAQSFKNRVTAGGTVSSTDNVNTAFNIATMTRSGTAQTISVNGGIASSNTSGQDVATIDSFIIGGAAGGTLLLDGSIAEILIYNRLLAAGERSLLRQYLSNKWAITLA